MTNEILGWIYSIGLLTLSVVWYRLTLLKKEDK